MSVQAAEKCFRLPHHQYSTLKERALHPFASRKYDELRAVQDVTFDVAQGEFFGIVGRNGSGKSTLLKCLAGIYSLDGGSMTVNGRLSPFIELGVGFNAEMTARDNVIINAIMLGLSRKQARARFDEIIEFAELEEFVDLKLKNYSSGMSVRLGFAVAIQVDADVLLVDEVLAVGDAAFQQKCFDEFDRLKAEGRTVLFVTHDMASVRALLRPRDADRARRDARDRRPGGHLPGLRRAQLRPAGQRRGQSRRRARPHHGRLVRGRRRRAPGLGQPGQPLHRVHRGRGPGRRDRPVFSLTFRNDVRHTIFVAASDTVSPQRPVRPRRAGGRALRVRQLARPPAATPSPRR